MANPATAPLLATNERQKSRKGLTCAASAKASAGSIGGGGVVWVETELPPESVPGAAAPTPVRRFAVVQDTGGAITGHGRVERLLDVPARQDSNRPGLASRR